MLTELANWGNYPKLKGEVLYFKNTEELLSIVKSSEKLAVRGAGLSYGDASLYKKVVSTEFFNKILAFDKENGTITIESGVTLDQLLRHTVPQGWFLYVTPGTKFITVGGAIGGDIHGKNHHLEGSFCNYVISMDVMLCDGTIISCNRESNAHIFHAACGGIGLGGIVIRATIKLKRISTSFIKQENIIVHNLDHMMQLLEEKKSSTYVVAWIDCLTNPKKIGKGVLMLGEHAELHETDSGNPLKIHRDPIFNIPFSLPFNILNRYLVKVFNLLYFNKHKLSKKKFITHYDSFFYPLDSIKNWNRLYGKDGFLQYQFVLPTETSMRGLREILKRIVQSQQASLLAVLKTLGESENLISFPMPGATLALDFPVNDRVLTLLNELDKIINDLGGRVYLVKDARMESEFFHHSYPNLDKFKQIINQIDPDNKFTSSLARRLQIKQTE